MLDQTFGRHQLQESRVQAGLPCRIAINLPDSHPKNSQQIAPRFVIPLTRSGSCQIQIECQLSNRVYRTVQHEKIIPSISTSFWVEESTHDSDPTTLNQPYQSSSQHVRRLRKFKSKRNSLLLSGGGRVEAEDLLPSIGSFVSHRV